MTSTEPVLADLRDLWGAALRDHLVGLYVHGSLVLGDFSPERSDLDLLAVLDADPVLDVLAPLHAELDRRHPDWAGRIEVEYVSVDAVRDFAGHLIARVSPGEDLHLLPATSHRAVTWATVRAKGRPLLGPPAADVLPEIDGDTVRAALLDHVRDWPVWVLDMEPPGAQAYSVLTMCRALQRLVHGRQLSKREAATASAEALPQWSALIVWARDWWYDGGADTDTGRFDEVRRFVTEVSAEILAAPPRPYS